MASLLGLALGCSGSRPKSSSALSATSEEGETETEPTADDPLFADETQGEEAEESGVDPASDGEADARTLEVVGKIVKDNRQLVRDCYDAQRKKDPTLKGSLTIHFVIDPEGYVMSAELNKERSEIQSPEVADCAIRLIKGLKFPPSSRGMETVVNYPFDLQPR